jgi:hypothetical protein
MFISECRTSEPRVAEQCFLAESWFDDAVQPRLRVGRALTTCLRIMLKVRQSFVGKRSEQALSSTFAIARNYTSHDMRLNCRAFSPYIRHRVPHFLDIRVS